MAQYVLSLLVYHFIHNSSPKSMYIYHLHLPVSSYSDSLSHPNDMWSSLGQHLMSSAISLSKHLSWWLSLNFTHVATYTQATCWGKVQWTWGRDWNSAHHFASLEYTIILINHPHPHPHPTSSSSFASSSTDLDSGRSSLQYRSPRPAESKEKS